MSNYIRACFCTSRNVQFSQWYNLLVGLTRQNCTFNCDLPGEVSGYLFQHEQTITVHEAQRDPLPDLRRLIPIAEWLSEPGYLTVNFGWDLGEQVIHTTLLQAWIDIHKSRAISLNVDDSVFLSATELAYTPNRDPKFDKYKMLIQQVISHLQPDIGMIDYEADLLCESLNTHDSIVGWGNFFSTQVLSAWAREDIAQLHQIVDEYISFDTVGLLTFIHPLQFNQAWTGKHEAVHQLLQRYW